ncbi:MAG TPA: NDP-sugar synthase [Solirubrobacteraceae bacterium]|nr:NDP-sugar synthase [Solirubrobacteraceae bacterium]
MQALILVGGEGTRLRPLTTTMPKAVVPLAGQPFMTYMLQWLAAHGVDDVVLSCGFLAGGVKAVLGGGEGTGVRVRYVEEPEPLGTGGALKYAEDLLEERFFMLNGDQLTDIDLSEQLAQHESTGARGTLALMAVPDPSSYGLVRLEPDRAVRGFLEKPAPDQIDTNLVNAGVYILERSVLADLPPAGTNFSIERDVFPRLVGQGLYGFPAEDAYWADIGTPERYLQATFDILEGQVRTEVGVRLAAAGLCLVDDAVVAGRVAPPALVGPGCRVAEHAVVGGRAVLGRDVIVEEGAHVESSVVLDGARIGPGAVVSGSIVGPGAQVGEGCRLEGLVMLGEGVVLGRDNVLASGARIFPGVHLPDGAIGF